MEKEKVIKDADDGNRVFEWNQFKEIMLRRHSETGTRPTNIGKIDGRVSEDMVNHPSRYTWPNEKSGIEVIHIPRRLDFDIGNAVKISADGGHKKDPSLSENEKTIEDLEKAIYINDKIAMLKRKNNDKNKERMKNANMSRSRDKANMLSEIPKTIAIYGKEDRMLLYLNISYLPYTKLWEASYDDYFSHLTKWRFSYDKDFNKCLYHMKRKLKRYIDGLCKISTYAKLKDVSVQTVYNWIDKGLVKYVEIDGVKYIDTTNK